MKYTYFEAKGCLLYRVWNIHLWLLQLNKVRNSVKPLLSPDITLLIQKTVHIICFKANFLDYFWNSSNCVKSSNSWIKCKSPTWLSLRNYSTPLNSINALDIESVWSFKNLTTSRKVKQFSIVNSVFIRNTKSPPLHRATVKIQHGYHKETIPWHLIQ